MQELAILTEEGELLRSSREEVVAARRAGRLGSGTFVRDPETSEWVLLDKWLNLAPTGTPDTASTHQTALQTCNGDRSITVCRSPQNSFAEVMRQLFALLLALVAAAFWVLGKCLGFARAYGRQLKAVAVHSAREQESREHLRMIEHIAAIAAMEQARSEARAKDALEAELAAVCERELAKERETRAQWMSRLGGASIRSEDTDQR